jgi:hypothetical protein
MDVYVCIGLGVHENLWTFSGMYVSQWAFVYCTYLNKSFCLEFPKLNGLEAGNMSSLLFKFKTSCFEVFSNNRKSWMVL